MTDSTDRTMPANGTVDDDREQGKQGLQTGPDSFTDAYAPAYTWGTAMPGVVDTATAAALERDYELWDATVSGPLARAAAEDAETIRIVERMMADQDAADAALFAALSDADALSPAMLAALSDADAVPVCDGDQGAEGADR